MYLPGVLPQMVGIRDRDARTRIARICYKHGVRVDPGWSVSELSSALFSATSSFYRKKRGRSRRRERPRLGGMKRLHGNERRPARAMAAAAADFGGRPHCASGRRCERAVLRASHFFTRTSPHPRLWHAVGGFRWDSHCRVDAKQRSDPARESLAPSSLPVPCEVDRR